MARIAILPGAVADQIAAGEVVERPASVVKELVENALDAGASSVSIAVEDGGRALVRVSDDGEGMSPDDVTLAVARHATSKIRAASDLVGVSSFGFRGEALPAISSVSDLELVSATADGDATSLSVSGGHVLAMAGAARRRGTTVTVSRLFHNVPARLKFLRGARSEWRAISDAVITAALVRRDVRFTLAHDGKDALSLPPASSLRERVAAIWGAAYADSLLDVEHLAGATHVSGLSERPAEVGTRARRTFLCVNGRAVRDTGITRAVESAYRSTLTGGLRPAFFLNIVLPGDLVDVNVHPAKAEVRFRDRWPLERVVENAVRRALGTLDSGAALGGYRPMPGADVAARYESNVDVEALRQPNRAAGTLFAPAPAGPLVDGVEGHPQPAVRGAAIEQSNDEEIIVPPLTQLRRSYIMFERDGGIVLLDQHSAHERVLYERFMNTLVQGLAPSQRLLFPLTLHLGPAQAEAFEEHREMLEKLGFEVEGFGGHTLLVSSVPLPHPRFDAERCLRETLDALTGDRMAASAPRHERLAATVACKAAVKAGEDLSSAEMRALFLDLARCTLPAHDVHGRATVVQLSWEELERRFGRR